MFINSLSNFTEFHRRKLEKIHCQICFLCSCWRNKISTNTDVSLWARADYLSFRPQSATQFLFALFLIQFSARARVAKTNVPSIERLFYLLNTSTICVIFLYYWTQKKTVSTRLVWNVITIEKMCLENSPCGSV